MRRTFFRFLAAAFGSAMLSLSTSAAPSQQEDPNAQLAAIAPRAIAWAEGLSAQAVRAGEPIGAALQDIARRNGVADPARIRVIVVDEIPLPEEPALKAAAVKVGLSQSRAGAMTLGYAVLVRRGSEDDVRLLSHEFRHVAQYEAAGGVAPFLAVHLQHLAQYGYDDSPFEVDARAHEVHAAPVPVAQSKPAAPKPAKKTRL